MDPWVLVVVPLGLGLVGFVEPCTVGSSLLFVKYLEGKGASEQVMETAVFTGMRALFFGSLGAGAALMGGALLHLQRWFWILLGVGYVVAGALYFAQKQGMLIRVLGLHLRRAKRVERAAALGVVFGLNVPACAAPLLAALMAASLGVGSAARGFVSMAVFGLALSLPLVVAVRWSRGRSWLDRLAALAHRVPTWTGIVFVVLGAWSVYFGLRK